MPQTLVSLSTTPPSSHHILRYRDKSFQISQMNLHYLFLKPKLASRACSKHDLGFLVVVEQNLSVEALWNLKKVLKEGLAHGLGVGVTGPSLAYGLDLTDSRDRDGH